MIPQSKIQPPGGIKQRGVIMKRTSIILSMLLTVAVPAMAISAEAPKAPESAASPAPKADAKPAAKAETKPAAEAANPNPEGTVKETMTSGGYTYAKLEKDGKSVWVAYSALETRVGDKLAFQGCTEMNGFSSKTLNKTFDTIYFCGAPLIKGAKGKAGNTKAKASTPGGKISVAKADAPNAHTVAELFAKRNSLNGKEVTVQAQVVKVATGIMNKNWLHLQDGTGSAKQKTNDLVVTTTATAQEGDIVTVSGKVTKDKDFGSGYKYQVIIENAVVKK
jgi:hypothetical protein